MTSPVHHLAAACSVKVDRYNCSGRMPDLICRGDQYRCVFTGAARRRCNPFTMECRGPCIRVNEANPIQCERKVTVHTANASCESQRRSRRSYRKCSQTRSKHTYAYEANVPSTMLDTRPRIITSSRLKIASFVRCKSPDVFTALDRLG